jgi:hypothetical protein
MTHKKEKTKKNFIQCWMFLVGGFKPRLLLLLGRPWGELRRQVMQFFGQHTLNCFSSTYFFIFDLQKPGSGIWIK